MFNPERFLKGSDSDKSVFVLDPEILDPAEVAFGFGRRVCPGKYMAYESVWITVASVLAVFEIGKAVDANGEVVPYEDYGDTFVRYVVTIFEGNFLMPSFPVHRSPLSAKFAPARSLTLP